MLAWIALGPTGVSAVSFGFRWIVPAGRAIANSEGSEDSENVSHEQFTPQDGI